MVSKVNLDMTEYRGLSTDTKPDDEIRNGSVFYEIDTGQTYYYDADGQQWVTAE